LVTFLFTDIESSTRLAQALGAGYRQVLADHRRLMRASLRDHGGAELLTEGDSFFAAFVDAGQALAASLAAQRALAAHPWPHPAARPKVRMGLHTGYAVAHGGEYASTEVHLAARIAAAAHGGQVLCSEETGRAAGRLPACSFLVDLGLHRLRGFDGRTRIHQLVAAGLDRDFPRPRTVDDSPHNLPAALTRFVGRDVERARLRTLLTHHRLLTVTGTGGIGKSRLTVQVARDAADHRPDGIWFTDLATAARPEQVPELVARSLGLAAEPGRDWLDTLGEELAGRRCLLVLDTCERQREAAAALVAGLLAACPRLTVLAAGRSPLALPGELRCRLGPLRLGMNPDGTPGDAVTLLADRTAASRGTGPWPGGELSSDWLVGEVGGVGGWSNGELVHLDRIARRLDGVPLALELAAARLRVLAAEDLADRLTDTIELLDGPGGGAPYRPAGGPAPARHASLRATVDWSYRTLAPPAARLLRWLSVFPGAVPLTAVEWLTAGWLDRAGTIDALATLVDGSLVEPEHADGAVGYRLLDPVRSFARHRLADTGEALAARDRHRVWRRLGHPLPHPRSVADRSVAVAPEPAAPADLAV
jgi:predicted ATPase/class 3 adenylate cyclase